VLNAIFKQIRRGNWLQYCSRDWWQSDVGIIGSAHHNGNIPIIIGYHFSLSRYCVKCHVLWSVIFFLYIGKARYLTAQKLNCIARTLFLFGRDDLIIGKKKEFRDI